MPDRAFCEASELKPVNDKHRPGHLPGVRRRERELSELGTPPLREKVKRAIAERDAKPVTVARVRRSQRLKLLRRAAAISPPARSQRD